MMPKDPSKEGLARSGSEKQRVQNPGKVAKAARKKDKSPKEERHEGGVRQEKGEREVPTPDQTGSSEGSREDSGVPQKEEAAQREEPRREEALKEGPQKEEARKEEPRKEEFSKEEPRKEEVLKGEPQKEASQKKVTFSGEEGGLPSFPQTGPARDPEKLSEETLEEMRGKLSLRLPSNLGESEERPKCSPEQILSHEEQDIWRIDHQEEYYNSGMMIEAMLDEIGVPELRDMAEYEMGKMVGRKPDPWRHVVDPDDMQFQGYFWAVGRFVKVTLNPRIVRNRQYRQEYEWPYYRQRNLAHFCVLTHWAMTLATNSYTLETEYELNPPVLRDKVLIVSKWLLLRLMIEAQICSWNDAEIFHRVWCPEEVKAQESPRMPFFSINWPPGLCIDRPPLDGILTDVAFSRDIGELPLVVDPLEVVRSLEDISSRHIEIRGLHKRWSERPPKRNSLYGFNAYDELELACAQEAMRKEDERWARAIEERIRKEKEKEEKEKVRRGKRRFEQEIHRDSDLESSDEEDTSMSVVPPYDGRDGNSSSRGGRPSANVIDVSGPKPMTSGTVKVTEQQPIVVVNPNDQFILKEVNYNTVKKLEGECRTLASMGVKVERWSRIEPGAAGVISWFLKDFTDGGKISKDRLAAEYWKTCSDREFFDVLKRAVGRNPGSEQEHYRNLYQLDLFLDTDVWEKMGIVQWVNKVHEVYEKFVKEICSDDERSSKRAEIEEKIVTDWIARWSRDGRAKVRFIAEELQRKNDVPVGITAFVSYLIKLVRELVEIKQRSRAMDRMDENPLKRQKKESDSGKRKPNAGPSGSWQPPRPSVDQTGGTVAPPQTTFRPKCSVCGNFHDSGFCGYDTHPDANHYRGCSFEASAKGQDYVRLGRDRIIPSEKLSDDRRSFVKLPEAQQKAIDEAKKAALKRQNEAKRQQNKQFSQGELLAALDGEYQNSDLYSTVIYLQGEGAGSKGLTADILIDPGNFGQDLISLDKLHVMNQLGVEILVEPSRQFRSPFTNGSIVNSVGSVNVDVRIRNDLTNNFELIPVKAYFVPLMKGMDMILSLRTYKKFGLHDKLRSHFVGKRELEAVDAVASIMESKELFGDPVEDDYEFPPTDSGIYDIREQFFEEEKEQEVGEKLLSYITFGGNESFKDKLREICQRHIRVFSKNLTKDPALIEPMILKVDDKAWQLPKNKRGPRSSQSEGGGNEKGGE